MECPPLRIALFEPDIPQNTAAILRLAACLGVGVDIVGPPGFLWDDRRLRRVVMDYLDHVEVRRHASWTAFAAATAPARKVLLTTKGATALSAFAFRGDDVLVMGRESAGVPEAVHRASDARLAIPIRPQTRSLNVAAAAAIALAEGLRQTGGWPEFRPRD